MKLFTIVAVTCAVLCTMLLYSGNANAVGGNEWKEVVKCMTAYKKATCKGLTGGDRVVCNHTAWCECFPEGCQAGGGGHVCLERALREHPGSEVAAGVALPNDHFMASLFIDENQNFKSQVKIQGDFRGMPGGIGERELLCEFDPFKVPIDAVAARADPLDPTCPITFDEEDILDLGFLSGGIIYDPDVDSDILYTDTVAGVSTAFELQVTDCAEILTTVPLNTNSNACPSVKDCGCEYVLGPVNRCHYWPVSGPPPGVDVECQPTCTHLGYNYNSGYSMVTVQILTETGSYDEIIEPSDPRWPEISPSVPYPQCPWGGYNDWCCKMRIMQEPVALLDSGGIEHDLPYPICDMTGTYDDDNDYDVDACEGDYIDDLDFDGIPETQTIFYSDCAFEKARQLNNDQKEWISTISAQISTMIASQARDLINKGYVVADDAPNFTPWDLVTVTDCLLDEGLDEAQEE